MPTETASAKLADPAIRDGDRDSTAMAASSMAPIKRRKEKTWCSIAWRCATDREIGKYRARS